MDAAVAFLIGFVVGMGFGAMAILFPEELGDDDES
jgi:hypothetical protein